MMFEHSIIPLFQSLSMPFFHYSNVPVSDRRLWLFSRRADFWLACGGASVGLLAAILLIFLRGDRELDALDFVLSEFHLGATYGAIVQRRLWRDRRIDVLLIPLVILALTYALAMSGQAIWLTSIAMYAAVWHRGRQNLGVARFYQRGSGGPVSRTHNVLFRGAIYLPMLAATLAYTHLAPAQYDEKPYVALTLGAEVTAIVGLATVVWVIAYLSWALSRTPPTSASAVAASRIHPGEWWVVVAHAVAFGSAYALGPANASFILVLAVHHEVQYLYFTYAMARRTAPDNGVVETAIDVSVKSLSSKNSSNPIPGPRPESNCVASFLLWPVVGFVGAVVGGWLQLNWLAPLGLGGLFCHYWLDGRIWTRQSLNA
jgi:hypothetical protein